MAERRARNKPWPYPGQSREEKARTVAMSYRDLVFDISQGRCDDPAGALHRLDWEWADYGVTWQVPSQAPLEEWMTAADLANVLNRPRKDIYNWARLKHITQRAGPDGAPEYLVSTVIAYQAKLRDRRARKAKP